MLEQRIEILRDAGQIDQETVDYLFKTMEFLGQKTNCYPNEENAAMLFTHFAMAISRQKNGETCGEMDAVLYEQLEADEQFSNAKSIWDNIHETCPITFDKVEEPFMLLHLTTFLTNVASK